MQHKLLHIEQLTKSFGSFTAVDKVSIQLKGGEIYGFLGPNGAGKTTTIKMLAAFCSRRRGTIVICGKRLNDSPLFCKKQTDYIPDRLFLYEKLTGAEYLGFIASLYANDSATLREAEQYLELFDLAGWQNNAILTACGKSSS